MLVKTVENKIRELYLQQFGTLILEFGILLGFGI